MKLRLFLCELMLLISFGSRSEAQVRSFLPAATIVPPDPGCLATDAWLWQTNARSDADGIHGHTFPEWNVSYWAMFLTSPLETTMTIRGRFPRSRYMSFEVYEPSGISMGGISDVEINPDPGQNNPFRTGTQQGTYTVRLQYGRKPLNPPANTFYTGAVSGVFLIYRVYLSTDPNDLAAATDPALPTVTIEGKGTTFASCPPRPVLIPEDLTINGRLDNIDFVGTVSPQILPTTLQPVWGFQFSTQFVPFPSRDNDYMYTFLSRRYLTAPYNFEMVVINMRAPSFPNTQAGIPPYTTADVRYWSFCQNEPLSGSVVRCVPDSAITNPVGYATVVMSDPGNRPDDSVLARWSATWMPWGALQPSDFIYDNNLNMLTNSNGVFWDGFLIYRQTVPSPSFTQSIRAITQLPQFQRRAAMGAYWPSIGYCTTATFDRLGPNCIPAKTPDSEQR